MPGQPVVSLTLREAGYVECPVNREQFHKLHRGGTQLCHKGSNPSFLLVMLLLADSSPVTLPVLQGKTTSRCNAGGRRAWCQR